MGPNVYRVHKISLYSSVMGLTAIIKPFLRATLSICIASSSPHNNHLERNFIFILHMRKPIEKHTCCCPRARENFGGEVLPFLLCCC